MVSGVRLGVGIEGARVRACLDGKNDDDPPHANGDREGEAGSTGPPTNGNGERVLGFGYSGVETTSASESDTPENDPRSVVSSVSVPGHCHRTETLSTLATPKATPTGSGFSVISGSRICAAAWLMPCSSGSIIEGTKLALNPP